MSVPEPLSHAALDQLLTAWRHGGATLTANGRVLATLAQQHTRVRAAADLHSPDLNGTDCAECGRYWPCPTIQALDS